MMVFGLNMMTFILTMMDFWAKRDGFRAINMMDCVLANDGVWDKRDGFRAKDGGLYAVNDDFWD